MLSLSGDDLSPSSFFLVPILRYYIQLSAIALSERLLMMVQVSLLNWG